MKMDMKISMIINKKIIKNQQIQNLSLKIKKWMEKMKMKISKKKIMKIMRKKMKRMKKKMKQWII